MSYGQNKPWGLQAVKTLNGATWNGQENPYLIRSGYPNNIFKGDPVIISGSTGVSDYEGYIVSLYDLGAASIAASGNTAFQTGSSLGVFNGCEFINTSGINPIDPASPGRSYWPAGTVTFGAVPATAFVTDDPNVVFNIQTTSDGGTPPTGITQRMMGRTAAVKFSFVSAGLVTGDFITGTSQVALDQTVMGTYASDSNYNLKILRIVPRVNNTSGVAYNNVEVVIQNHFLCSRPLAAQ